MVFSFFKKTPEKMVAKPAAAPRPREAEAAPAVPPAETRPANVAPVAEARPVAVDPVKAVEAAAASLDFSEIYRYDVVPALLTI